MYYKKKTELEIIEIFKINKIIINGIKILVEIFIEKKGSKNYNYK